MAHTYFKASDRSYAALIKKDIHRMAVEGGFAPKKIDEIDIVVAEITSNLYKYGKDGELLVQIIEEADNSYLEIIAIDSGPGMNEPSRMMEDGVSTAGTLGQGLGAIKRLSDNFDLYTLRNWGTILLSRLYNKPLRAGKKQVLPLFRQVVVAKPGETACGDGCIVHTDGHMMRVMLGDGLGHGREAAAAVAAASKALVQCNETDPVAIIRDIHANVKRTRGLVGMIVVFDLLKKTARMCGIGNIAAKSFSAMQYKNHVSYNGIIGLNIPGTLKDQSIFTGDSNQYLVMCSDGIKSQWEISRYPGILKYDLTILAAAIYKDFSRKTDDMSVVVGKIN